MQMTGSTLEGKLLRRPGHLTMPHRIHNDQVIPEAKWALLMMPTSAMRGYLVPAGYLQSYEACRLLCLSPLVPVRSRRGHTQGQIGEPNPISRQH
jgi:hypothetical protein